MKYGQAKQTYLLEMSIVKNIYDNFKAYIDVYKINYITMENETNMIMELIKVCNLLTKNSGKNFNSLADIIKYNNENSVYAKNFYNKHKTDINIIVNKISEKFKKLYQESKSKK